MLALEGEYGAGEYRGVNQDDTRLGVVSAIHGAEVVSGTSGGLKEHGDELAGGGRARRSNQETN